MIAFTLLLAAARGALVLATALAAMPLLRRASAALRRRVLVAAFGAVVALPIASALLPSLRVPVSSVTRIDESAAVPALLPDSITHSTQIDDSSTAPSPSLPPSRATWTPSGGQVVLAIWALGALAVLARFGIGLVRARALARGGRLVATERVRGRAVQVRLSREVETPAVAGLLAPVILLPHEAPSWTEERRSMVLLHELAHIERRDTLANAIAVVACALHWFNPLAWIAARRLRFERERAADDRVVESGVRPSCYAEHLLALATTHADGSIPTGTLAMAQRSSVEERIVALLVPVRASAPRSRAPALLLGGGAVTLLIAVACATPDGPSAPGASSPSATAHLERRGGAALGAVAPSELTLDPALQAIAEEETDRMAAEWKSTAAVVIVLDPTTGAVLAMTSRASDARTQIGVQRAFYPGSTMKPFVVAAALEEGAITASQRFDCATRAYGAGPLYDPAPHGVLDVTEILTVSSNVGMSRIYDELGGAKLITWTKRFHFGAAPSLRISDVASGEVPSSLEDRSLRGAVVAIGQGLTATPIQIAAAFAAIANGGVYHPPTLVRRASTGERVLREETARTVLTMLESVVYSDLGTGNAARVSGVRVAGKTGTADQHPNEPVQDAYYASFVGTAPTENPRYVVLVGAEAVGKSAYGGNVAAPVFARIVTRALAR